jgi:hypothetical protein
LILFITIGQISSIRVQTDKATGKGKGFAFMEFSDVDSMQVNHQNNLVEEGHYRFVAGRLMFLAWSDVSLIH